MQGDERVNLEDRLWADLQAISLEPRPEALRQMVESWSQSLEHKQLRLIPPPESSAHPLAIRQHLDTREDSDTVRTHDKPEALGIAS